MMEELEMVEKDCVRDEKNRVRDDFVGLDD